MKTIKNEVCNNLNGEPIKNEKGKIMKIRDMIEIVLKNSRYKNNSEQMQGYIIMSKKDQKLKIDNDKQGQWIKIEDADFELIKKLAESYEPFLNGLTFAPFLEALKIANKE